MPSSSPASVATGSPSSDRYLARLPGRYARLARARARVAKLTHEVLSALDISPASLLACSQGLAPRTAEPSAANLMAEVAGGAPPSNAMAATVEGAGGGDRGGRSAGPVTALLAEMAKDRRATHRGAYRRRWGRMPDSLRASVIAAVSAGKTHSAVARMTGISMSSVHNILHDARVGIVPRGD